MSAETPAAPSLPTRWRLRFRAWRGSRPFWAGLFVMIGGVPIMYFPYAHLTVGQLTIRMSTTAGAGSLIIGVLLVVMGISLWFQKHVRTFAGTAAILLGLVSLPVSNFGGFIVGFLFALVGGALAIAWAPGVPEESTRYGVPAGDGTDAAPTAAEPVLPVSAEATDGTDTAVEPGGLDMSKSNEPYELNDLSGTSPVNGANGRRSAG
ncbi:DUF6114 domain-containing protein [Streptomyces sp. WI04-05B]|uniref:DUF6114 domain-containing protein n=1 Tax=Streptomyces TaxID=1883 RepID=UPI0029A76F8D|nr:MULTISPECIES: DUF6114 domain-containing protein [unclassified Streptomyces]MDX2547037.1 DUF6114 domain-containing protein [Streptomyces sp. WI04-05B]MDX2589726.1 DUF6114 domain-containing protein [Streptomyces sp. WI04-05A]MDX3753176.1 DUF6114 domain-containing protein [Streptomyces sp. AK08-02]